MTARAGERALSPALVLLALGPFALGYFFAYLFRAVNAVVAPDLVRDLSLSASGLGFLTAAYLIAYAAAQLPVGIAFDRYGPRRVQALMLALAACGALLFALASNFATLVVARALIGAGCAGSLMAGFKSVAMWLPEQRRPLGNAFGHPADGAGAAGAQPRRDLRRPGVLAHRTARRDDLRQPDRHPDPVGRAVAARCRRPAARRCGAGAGVDRRRLRRRHAAHRLHRRPADAPRREPAHARSGADFW